MNENRLVLLTGGTSGIGWALAQAFAAAGCPLLLVSNQRDALPDCAQQIMQQYNVPCRYFYLDLAQPDAAQMLFDHCQQEALTVDVLVNNAGILLFSEVSDAPISKISTILQLHIHTPTMLCRLFGAAMRERGDGHILNVASISAVMPYPGISIYGPSKTYMRYFSRALRTEMLACGVNVTCLIPGATLTALYDPQRVNLGLARRLGIMATAETVARQALIALRMRHAECVPGWLNKLTVTLMPCIPAWLISWLHRKTNILQKGKESLG